METVCNKTCTRPGNVKNQLNIIGTYWVNFFYQHTWDTNHNKKEHLTIKDCKSEKYINRMVEYLCVVIENQQNNER